MTGFGAPRPGPAGGAQPGPGGPPPASPAPVGDGAATGTVAALGASVTALAELADLPVAEHVARYDALHGELSEALAAIDGI